MKRISAFLACAGCVSLCAAAAPGESTDLLLLVRDAPAHGIVVAPVSLPETPAGRAVLRAAASVNGRDVPAQLVAPLGGEHQWLAVLKLPGGGDHDVRLKLTEAAAEASRPAAAAASNAWVELRFDAKNRAALLSAVTFRRTKKRFETLAWNDRLHDPKLGSFHLRHGAGRVEALAAGPVCTVVRTHAAYAKPDGSRPESKPEASYDWLLFRDAPLLLVRAHVRQASPRAWRELHFLELSYPDESFGTWAGGEPLKAGRFTATRKTSAFGDWAMLRDGPNAIAMLRAGRMIFYDGRGGYGTYLHAHATRAWQGWRDAEASFSAWLWLGDAAGPVAEVRKAADALPTAARVVSTTAALYERIDRARKAALKIGDAAARGRRLHEIALVEKLQAAGRWRQAAAALAPGAKRPWHTVTSGDLAVAVEATGNGVKLLSVYDLASGTELAAAQPPPLFAVTMKHVKTGRTVRLASDAGWREVRVVAREGLLLNWRRPDGDAPAPLSVAASCLPDARAGGVCWWIIIKDVPDDWAVWRVAFPQVGLGPFARDVRVLAPQAAGVVKRDVWRKPFRFKGTYPAGWTAMQFMAAYDAAGTTGLYVAAHDPRAHTKDIAVESDAARHRVVMSFDHPAPDMGTGGTGFALSGRAVWRVLRGDWFDAAMIYRAWVRKEASWYPKLGPDGRADTPRWMRELCVWGMLGGGAKGAVAAGKAFSEAMGLPTGFHWYSWHRIPFDNDYPHYFPPKEGFAAAVAELQKSPRGVYVMPYINGRLWDTRDKGAEDFEFTKLARAAATKDEAGKVRTESYGSKESDGTPVKLAAMCPATQLWRDRVKGIVLRLMNECGVKAVYIDQIAAARPRLCFDASHGHPLGGGGWWPEAYGKLLTDLRKAMPADRVLTTECNAEPYVKWFDGYLTWHWQYDGQVPAFPAVYGGAIQMFGRAYRGGPTKDRALRMKAGQQLVFGEQIGWIDSGAAKQAANAAFLRHVAHLRHGLRRYFYAGQMARPPRLVGEMPTVTADWQWHGVWPVTTDAVLTGVWELPAEHKLALLFVNVSGKPVTAELAFDAATYGLAGGRLTVTPVTPAGRGAAQEMPMKFRRKITFEPERATALEIAPAAAAFDGKRSQWHGCERFDFTCDGRKCIVVAPKTPAPGRPWIWRARFFGHEPQTDVALLANGFHVAYMDVAGLFGCPKAVARWNAFHKLLTERHGLSARPALEGMSRGGLIIFNWAAANPHKVACIYADAPVCDFKSWPGGKGKGKGAAGVWRACLKVYGLSEAQAAAYDKNPVDNLAPLARASVPLLHVVGAADQVVPVAENTSIVEARYRKLGGSIRVISKPGCGHHPHSLKDPAPIVEFILRHASAGE